MTNDGRAFRTRSSLPLFGKVHAQVGIFSPTPSWTGIDLLLGSLCAETHRINGNLRSAWTREKAKERSGCAGMRRRRVSNRWLLFCFQCYLAAVVARLHRWSGLG